MGGALSFLRDKILYHQDELLFELFENELNEVFDNLAKKVSEMENLSGQESSKVKERLLKYKM